MHRFAIVFIFLLVGLPLNAFSHKDVQAEVVMDEVKISDVWARAGKPNSAAFMKLFNTSGKSVKIIGAKTDITERVELHDHIQEGDVMKMRAVESIEIPAGQVVELKPGGKHVMFFDIKDGLKEGQDFKLTLAFDNGSQVEMSVPVKAMRHKGDCSVHKDKGDCPCPKSKKHKG